ncbi:MAG: TetR/AcrR family transcriptional regulator [Chloroflexi bacterium]|nr:MAG: TetR/AcrR family transcriptional regulator [Chloroflexota bacterium]
MMTPKTDLRETITEVSCNLFMEQGYASTSIKQIADAAGCTTAALYYYYEDGKEAILHKVIEQCVPDMMGMLATLEGASSLYELVMRLGDAMRTEGPELLRRLRWLMIELPNMGEAERAMLHNRKLEFMDRLTDLIEPFVDGRQQAEMLAWVNFCALFGYGQTFISMDLRSYRDVPDTEFVEMLATMTATTYGK